MITTCYDVKNLFASRPEFSWLTDKTPKEHLEELIHISDVVNRWMGEQYGSRPEDCPLFLQHWHWLPLLDDEDAYGAKLPFGARAQDEVMDYLRRQRPSIYQYPSMLYIICRVPHVPEAIEPARRGVGTSTTKELGFPGLRFHELPSAAGERNEMLRRELDSMAELGYKVYRELRKEKKSHVLS